MTNSGPSMTMWNDKFWIAWCDADEKIHVAPIQ
jgi:hypothetical protein